MKDPVQIALELPITLMLLVVKHPLTLFILLVALFYGGRGRRWARALLVVLALVFTGLAAYFVYLGFDMKWSSDGPGLLLVEAGIAVFGFLATVTWVLWVVRMRR